MNFVHMLTGKGRTVETTVVIGPEKRTFVSFKSKEF